MGDITVDRQEKNSIMVKGGIMMAKKKTIKIKPLDITKIPKGHSQHRSGAGPHEDTRTNRNRTRSQQNKKSIEED